MFKGLNAKHSPFAALYFPLQSLCYDNTGFGNVSIWVKYSRGRRWAVNQSIKVQLKSKYWYVCTINWCFYVIRRVSWLVGWINKVRCIAWQFFSKMGTDVKQNCLNHVYMYIYPLITDGIYWAIIGVTRDFGFCGLIITFRHLIRQIWDTEDLFWLNPPQCSNYVHVMIGLLVNCCFASL